MAFSGWSPMMNKHNALEKLRQFNLSAAPGHLLRRNHQRSVDIFSRTVGDDVTRQQIGTLIALYHRPGASQRDLVDATGIDKSTLKEMLGRMTKRGWVKRERDPQDSRAWTMHLTDEGLETLLDRVERVEAAQLEILEPLPDKDRAIFMGYLRKIAGLNEQS
jgi:DNA-binding MarR family transcriptional regulator